MSGRGKFRKLSLVVWLLLASVVISVGLVAVKIRQVECHLPNGIDSSEICLRLQPLVGNSFFFTDFENSSVVNRALKAEDMAQTFSLESVKKQLPGTVIFELSQKAPLYRLLAEGDQKYLVTESGQLKTDNPRLKLPEARLFPGWSDSFDSLDLKAASTHYFLKQLIMTAAEEQLKIETINFESSTLIRIKLDSQLFVVLEKNSQPSLEMKRLAVIIDNLNFKEIDTGIKEVDLRFKLPVLRTQLVPVNNDEFKEIIIDSQS